MEPDLASRREGGSHAAESVLTWRAWVRFQVAAPWSPVVSGEAPPHSPCLPGPGGDPGPRSLEVWAGPEGRSCCISHTRSVCRGVYLGNRRRGRGLPTSRGQRASVACPVILVA